MSPGAIGEHAWQALDAHKYNQAGYPSFTDAVEAVLVHLDAARRRETDLEAALRELREWAEDACHQGAGEPRGVKGWHMYTSTWEYADELLPRVDAVLAVAPTPDPSPWAAPGEADQ